MDAGKLDRVQVVGDAFEMTKKTEVRKFFGTVLMHLSLYCYEGKKITRANKTHLANMHYLFDDFFPKKTKQQLRSHLTP